MRKASNRKTEREICSRTKACTRQRYPVKTCDNKRAFCLPFPYIESKHPNRLQITHRHRQFSLHLFLDVLLKEISYVNVKPDKFYRVIYYPFHVCNGIFGLKNFSKKIKRAEKVIIRIKFHSAHAVRMGAAYVCAICTTCNNATRCWST